MQLLFVWIIFGLLGNFDEKYSLNFIYWREMSINMSSILLSEISPGVMANPCVIRYNRQQLWDYRSVPRKLTLPNKETFTLLKELGILKYRGKRGGRLRTKSNAGVHHQNLIQIKLDHTLLLNAQRKKHLKLCTVNTRSVRGKTAELLQHILEVDIDLCVITETWLCPDGDDIIRGEFSQEGYCFDDVPRPDRKGGGLAILYRNNLKVSRCPPRLFQSFECVEWKVCCQSLIFVIFGIYRPPYSERNPVTLAMFMSEFAEFLDQITTRSESQVFLGDFNIHVDNNTDCYSKQFQELLRTFGLTQHVCTPTHISGHILDLIITKTEDKRLVIKEPTSDYYISDHSFVTCNVEQPRPPLVRKVRKSRNWKNVSEDALQNDLCIFNDIVGKYSNVNDLVSQFTRSTSDIIDKHAPVTTRTLICRPSVPWHSGYLKQLKNFRRSIEKIFMSNKSDLTKKVYNRVRNYYSVALSRAKDNYYQNKVGQAAGDVKKLYAVTSDLLGRSKDNPLPVHSSSVSLANDFQRYFADKISKLRNELDNLPSYATDSSSSHSTSLMDRKFSEFEPLSESDIKRLVFASKSSTCELDVIPTIQLKKYFAHFIAIVTEIVNQSLLTGVFPDDWKNAVIKPLLKKKGLPLELPNYRPVSNLTFLSKILEKAALNQINEYIEDNNLLPAYQSAYRKYHGVETAMVKMYHDLLENIENNKVTIVVMIDLSAAFDTIDVPILLELLQQDFGIQDTPLKWIESYLTNRTTSVIIDQSKSDSEPLRFGVPQGSCAGPVIFTLYISALNKVVEKYSAASLYGYADDHKLALSIEAGNPSNVSSVLAQLDCCLNDIITWMTTHKLKMNQSKTEIIFYGTKQQLSKLNIEKVNVGGINVKCVDQVRDLGVIMTNTLSFDQHIQKKCQIANIQLRNLRTLRRHLTQESTETLVHGLVHSHIDFCNSLYTDIPAYQVNKLQRVQNHAARVVLNVSYHHPSAELLKRLHWLPVKARVMFKVLVLVFRVIAGTAPIYIKDMFVHKNTSRYRLRSQSDVNFHIPRRRTKLADRSLAVVGAKLWNNLPSSLKNIQCEVTFRARLKTHLFQQFHN